MLRTTRGLLASAIALDRHLERPFSYALSPKGGPSRRSNSFLLTA